MFAGPPPSSTKIASKYVPRSFVGTYNPDFNAFFRRRTTVNVGGTVTFQVSGFHTIDLPGKRLFEVHTATFGPTSYLEPLEASFRTGPTISPIGTLRSGSRPPTRPPT